MSTMTSTATPEQVLASIVRGINSGDLESLMGLYEPGAAFATAARRPSPTARPASAVALAGFIALEGELDLEVTRVLEVGDLALVVGNGRSRARGRTGSRCGWPPTTPTSCAASRTAPGDS